MSCGKFVLTVSKSLPPSARAAPSLSALGDPTRRAIFELLAAGPRAVGDLAAEVPVSRPAVSQHLKVLKQAGLVHDQQAGSRRLYAVDTDGVTALREYFDQFWSRALGSFKTAAERPEAEK
jgi:DNA-binding transcriptional ArsR family regulator